MMVSLFYPTILSTQPTQNHLVNSTLTIFFLSTQPLDFH
nr:MAG TPA: hypothetical protein [Caudoviricetes sp.]